MDTRGGCCAPEGPLVVIFRLCKACERIPARPFDQGYDNTDQGPSQNYAAKDQGNGNAPGLQAVEAFARPFAGAIIKAAIFQVEPTSNHHTQDHQHDDVAEGENGFAARALQALDILVI